MTIVKTNNHFTFSNHNDILAIASSQDEVINLLLNRFKIKPQEVDKALTSMIRNNHNVIEFGELGSFIYSKENNNV